MQFDKIGKLAERYLEIVDSASNRENRRVWDNAGERYLLERWRGRSNRSEKAPFTMAMDISGYAQMLGIDCEAYYTQPDVNLHEQLRYAIWEYEHIDSDRYFENAVFSSFGSVFEASFFGSKIHYLKGSAPWYDERDAVFSDKKKLLNLKPFDFYTTGLCPRAISFYENAKDKLRGCGIEPMFPVNMRSPFSTAIMLRGLTPLLMDFYDDPDFVHALMSAVTGYLKEFMTARSRYLGKPIDECYLFNDEVATPMLSPDLFEEFILPYEIELSEHCGGVRYWHSCGVSQAFYSSVAKIPGLKMMHIGPWSDIEKAVEVFGPRQIPLEICVSSNRDMYEKTPDQMVKQLARIREICEGKVRYSVRCDGIAVLHTKEETLKKMDDWCRAARRALQS